ncbi:hypothetical protein TNCT_409381 [Trichonephila clavata]|uniref:Uncharacterized protein n=1 Tax=Trichonephila clavata TaxID=2740835 RepID=A0A8X6KYM5_TRICU|nr:hypothetical protein TNCT_106941 [Trichonephila clavata]GFQ88966.1 hypothetical protein TNCT_409381 [Trichonephila clavata]
MKVLTTKTTAACQKLQNFSPTVRFSTLTIPITKKQKLLKSGSSLQRTNHSRSELSGGKNIERAPEQMRAKLLFGKKKPETILKSGEEI